MNKLLDFISKKNLERIAYAVILVICIIVTNSCGSADKRFLATNQKASITYGNKLIYFYDKYGEQENLSKKNIERRTESIKAWQESCSVALKSHENKDQ